MTERKYIEEIFHEIHRVIIQLNTRFRKYISRSKRYNNEKKNWVSKFSIKYGRKPRVLHIGNIANNAYNNAKLLNDVGLENHVISINDYYVMSCPEWEDADFYGEIEDLFKPVWHKLKLNGFKRPKWFAQGELYTCADYLVALCEHDRDNMNRLFHELSIQNKLEISKIHNISVINKLPLSYIKNSVINIFTYVSNSMLKITQVFSTYTDSILRKLECSINSVKVFLHRFIILRKPKRWIKYKLYDLRFYINYSLIRRIRHNKSQIKCSLINKNYNLEYGVKVAELIDRFKINFKECSSCLSQDDFIPLLNTSEKLEPLLEYYDVVIGYATEGIYPLLKGIPYFCYEHGTLRDIPYQDDAQGMLCALTYRQAEHVFVTNFDCKRNAQHLAPGKFTMVNHAYDEDHPDNLANDWMKFRKNLADNLQSEFLLFHPTRHDWVVGEGYADKANDALLKAFAELRQSGLSVGLVCCEWGHNVEHSKNLLEELGVSKYVQWHRPLGTVSFTRMCKACDIVVDQFFLGTFGGITFKALASGTAVLSSIDEKLILNQFSEVPPIINCKTQDNIKASISYYYSNANELNEIGIKGKKWMKKYHNKKDLIDAQLVEFEKILF